MLSLLLMLSAMASPDTAPSDPLPGPPRDPDPLPPPRERNPKPENSKPENSKPEVAPSLPPGEPKMCTHKDCKELAVLYPVLMMRGLRWNGAFPLPLDIGVCAAHREELEEQLLSEQAWKKGITPMWNEMAKPKGSNFAGLKPSRHLLKITWEKVVQPPQYPAMPEELRDPPGIVLSHMSLHRSELPVDLDIPHGYIVLDSLTVPTEEAEAEVVSFSSPIKELWAGLAGIDVHADPEPEAAGLGFVGNNLCGGTGMRLDPLAHEGWAGECPGCGGCVELAPDTEDQTRAAIFAGDLAADALAAGITLTFTIPPDVHAEAPQPGLSEGSRCSRTHNSDGQELYADGSPCDGIMERMDVQDCSCHLNPPCHNHVNAGLQCSECEQIVDVDEEVAS